MPSPASHLQPPASPLKVAFFGTPQFSVPILSSIMQQHQIALVVSQPAKPVGPKQLLTPSPVAQFALDHRLPLLTPANIKDLSPVSHLPQVDVAIVAAYGHILPQWLLDWPRLGCINIHTSLLPKYRGASPITAALLNGDARTGITFIKMNTKMDQGPIIDQLSIDIDIHETSDSLSIKMSQSASKYINKVLETYTAEPSKLSPQNHQQATYTHQIAKQHGYLDLDHLPTNWQQRIYAYHSWPGAWTTFKGKRIKLLPQGMVQAEGKKATPLSDFLNGYPDFPLKQPW